MDKFRWISGESTRQPKPCPVISGGPNGCACRLEADHTEPHTCAAHGCRWIDVP